MRRLRPLNRREFLGVIGHGTVALVAQLSLTRNVLAIALGGSSLAACATNGVPTASPTNTAAPPTLSPTLPNPTDTAAPTTTTAPPAATATFIPRPTEASMLTYLPIAAGVANAYVLVRGEEVAIGHTKGHICVYDPVGSALILGDALNNIGGQLSGPNPSFTQDMAQATASARKLAALTFERAYFGHGTPIENGASKAIAALFPP